MLVPACWALAAARRVANVRAEEIMMGESSDRVGVDGKLFGANWTTLIHRTPPF